MGKVKIFKVLCYHCDGINGGCKWCNFSAYMTISITGNGEPYNWIEQLSPIQRTNINPPIL